MWTSVKKYVKLKPSAIAYMWKCMWGTKDDQIIIIIDSLLFSCYVTHVDMFTTSLKSQHLSDVSKMWISQVY